MLAKLARGASLFISYRTYSLPPNTRLGLPENLDRLSQVKKFTVIDASQKITTSNTVTNISLHMKRSDRVELIKKGPTPVFPTYQLEITVKEEDDSIRTKQFNFMGTHNAFLHERCVKMHNNRPCIEFYMSEKAISAHPFPLGTLYRIYTDSTFSNPQLFHLIYKGSEITGEESAIIDVRSDNTDAEGFLKIGELQHLMKSKRWCVRVDEVNYLLLIRNKSRDTFHLINMFCYHLGNSLFTGKLYARNGADEDQESGTLLECPQCEFKFTDLSEASYNLKISNGNLYANIDLNARRTGRSIMSNAETLQSYIDQHRVKRII